MLLKVAIVFTYIYIKWFKIKITDSDKSSVTYKGELLVFYSCSLKGLLFLYRSVERIY